MQNFKPEGQTILTPSNQAALSSPNSLHEACIVGDTLESRALLCDKEHNLRVDLGCMYGIIPHNEGALGIDNGSVRDIALISRVNKPVMFKIIGFKRTITNVNMQSSAEGLFKKTVWIIIFQSFAPVM